MVPVAEELVGELERGVGPVRLHLEDGRLVVTNEHDWHKAWRIEKQALIDVLESALRTIRGPEDRGIWMIPYREAGGGYEGLQAIARAALGEV